MEVNIQNSNINLDEFIEKYLSGVSEDLINNPQFRPQLISALEFLTRKDNEQETLEDFNIIIGKNGLSFSITSGIRTAPKKDKPDLENNRNYDKVEFVVDNFDIDETGVDKRKGLEVIRSKGTFYKTAEYVKSYPESGIGKKAKTEGEYYLSTFPTIVSAHYDHRRFSREGIEIEHSTYEDKCPCQSNFDTESDIKYETDNHKPTLWKFKTYPNSPKSYEECPTVTNKHRYKYRLGIVTSYKRVGKDDSSAHREAYDYVFKGDYPEYIAHSDTFFKDHNVGMINEVFTSKYPEGTKPLKIESEISLSFFNNLDASKTRGYRPELLEEIRSLSQTGLKEVYGIKVGDQPHEQPTVAQ